MAWQEIKVRGEGESRPEVPEAVGVVAREIREILGRKVQELTPRNPAAVIIEIPQGTGFEPEKNKYCVNNEGEVLPVGLQDPDDFVTSEECFLSDSDLLEVGVALEEVLDQAIDGEIELIAGVPEIGPQDFSKN